MHEPETLPFIDEMGPPKPRLRWRHSRTAEAWYVRTPGMSAHDFNLLAIDDAYGRCVDERALLEYATVQR